MGRWWRRAPGLVFLILLVMSGGCRLLPRRIPFESLLEDDSCGWRDSHPGLVVVSTAQDLQSLSGLLSYPPFEELIALGKVELAAHSLIAVFQGEQGTGGYEIKVQSIRQLGNDIQVRATFIRPKLSDLVFQGTTEPYHLVRIQKADLSGRGPFTFILIDAASGKEVARRENISW